MILDFLYGGWLMIQPVMICLFPHLFLPDYLVLTYGRGWVHINELRDGEAIHGMMLPYLHLK